MRFAAIIIVSLLVLGGGTYGLLVYTGAIKVGVKPPPPHVIKLEKGQAWVPYSAREMTAGTQMTPEMLVNAKTGQPSVRPIAVKDALAAGVIIEPQKLTGRVLKRDKHAGHPFTEGDFFPKGTPPGDTGFVPRDKIAVTLNPTKLLGVRTLKRGDHVDMVSAQKFDPRQVVYPPGQRPIQVQRPMLDAVVKYLVHDGVVVNPVTVLQVVKGGTFKKPKDTTSEEMKIAVGFDEVAGLEEALESGATVTCFLRSGLPDASTQPIVINTAPPPTPDQLPKTIETVKGHDHHLITVSPADTQPTQPPVPAVVGAPPITIPPLVPPTPATPVPPIPPTPVPAKTPDADFQPGGTP